jgi:peptidoglycan/LPS O-acetylase OafA/YrhL
MAYTAPRLGDLILRHQDVSYGVYIYHGLILNLVIASAVHFGLGAYVVLVACTIAVAFLSWRLIERPCLQLKSRPQGQLGRFKQKKSGSIRAESSAQIEPEIL